jgi:hypothetical protein
VRGIGSCCAGRPWDVLPTGGLGYELVELLGAQGVKPIYLFWVCRVVSLRVRALQAKRLSSTARGDPKTRPGQEVG